jgi:phosphohistidine phosphatase SixA
MTVPVLLATVLAILIALSPIDNVASANAPIAQQLQGRALLDALRGGGYVLLFRHAITDRSERDADLNNLENCATQRNLSVQGRQQATAIGEAFRQLQIPVAIVLASPYCRTLETARLAFGVAEPSADLISELSDSAPGSRERLTAALHGMLGRSPEAGANTVLVTHVLNIESALGFEIEEGEAIVANPAVGGGYAVVARVLAEGWLPLDAHSERNDGLSTSLRPSAGRR